MHQWPCPDKSPTPTFLCEQNIRTIEPLPNWESDLWAVHRQIVCKEKEREGSSIVAPRLTLQQVTDVCRDVLLGPWTTHYSLSQNRIGRRHT